jgi:hypothetical protein
VVWTFFHRLAQTRLSRRLIRLSAIRLLLVPVGVGVGIGIGIDSDCVLWLVLTQSNNRPTDIRDRCTGPIRFRVSKSRLLSFDSDSDTYPDTDHNPYRDRDAFVLY